MIEQCVILCGGLGTRLGPLTSATPKPLLPAADRPFLEWLALEALRQGCRRFLLLSAFRSEQMFDFAAMLRDKFDIAVEVSVEPGQAGTGGALWHARDRLDEAFMLLNGDSYFDVKFRDLAALLDRNDAAAMALRPVQDASRYGVVELAEQRVRAFHPRPPGPGPGTVNGGVYAMRRAICAHLADRCSLENDVLPRLAEAGAIAGRSFDSFFLDIGVPEAYASAQSEIPALLTRPAIFFDRDGVLNVDHGHVGSVERFEWVPGAREAIREAKDRGFFVFVVTNQAGIGRGLYTEDAYLALRGHVHRELARAGAHVDGERYCPYHPEAVVEAYRRSSEWRKPGPGMIVDVLRRWPIAHDRSFLVGDRATDLEAAARAGIQGFRFTGGDLLQFMLRETPLGGNPRERRHP